MSELFYQQKEPFLRCQTDTNWDAITYSWQEPLLNFLIDLDFIWLDIININQNSKDILQELQILPAIYKHENHKVINLGAALQRGWCCFEIAVHNADVKKKSALGFGREQLHALHKAVQQHGSFEDLKRAVGVTNPEFEKCMFTVEKDREQVYNEVINGFKDVKTFNDLVDQVAHSQLENWKLLIEQDSM